MCDIIKNKKRGVYMYQGELRKYDPGELSAYFKGADRLYYWIRDDIRNLEKKRISIDKL